VSRRAAISPDDDRRWVFNRLAAAYRARPPYPPALVERLCELAGGAGARAADLGAGTGLLALPLRARGLRVAAVEPARAMLAELARAGGPGLELVHAAAEATGLAAGSVDLVLVADALQWIDPERGAAEARRILAPAGALAAVTVSLADTPFLRALGERIASYNPKARPGPPPVALFFSLAGLPVPAEEPFLDEAPLDPPALEALLGSLTYVGPALGPRRLAALLADARELAAAHGGAVWRREIRLAWARLPRGWATVCGSRGDGWTERSHSVRFGAVPGPRRTRTSPGALSPPRRGPPT
jgi:SAM-dependent methyltransferase